MEAAILFIEAHNVELLMALGAHLALLAGSAGAATYALIRIPEDYLEKPDAASLWPERMGGRIGKNIVGVVLLVGGGVLALPGAPGPGVLTAALGLTLLDIPGTDRVVRRVIGAPMVLPRVNRLRAFFGRAPLRRFEGSAEGAP